MKVEGEDGVEALKERYRVDKELVSQTVAGSELAMGNYEMAEETYIVFAYRAKAKR